MPNPPRNPPLVGDEPYAHFITIRRDDRWSNWSVKLGPKTYKLHTFALARASDFFEGHMSLSPGRETEGWA